MSAQRKIIQIATCTQIPAAPFKVPAPRIIALADDGSVWSITTDPLGRHWTYWQSLPAFPVTDEQAELSHAQWQRNKYVNPLLFFKLLFRRKT